MAFVNALSVGTHVPAKNRSSSFVCNKLVSRDVRAKSNTPRMGYGDYSYLTDKTKGHVNQYYVDKFRIASDFSKGVPASLSDAKLGRDQKGRVIVPEKGIPQAFDSPIPERDATAPPDPRIAEAEGAVFAWDPAYVDPKFSPGTYENCEDPAVAEDAFQKFRASVNEQRGAVLTRMDFGAVERKKRIRAGLDEKYLLCLDGSLDVRYAVLQDIADPPTFTPTGEPQTEIPGQPYTGSVGAMDFMLTPGEEIAFWKQLQAKGVDEPVFKKPSGSDTPELPYNVSATVDQLKDAQKARDIISP